MTPSIQIVTDGVADIPAEFLEKHQVHTVPIHVVFGTEEFVTGVDLSHAEFYAKTALVTDENFPKTSQPIPHQFKELYTRLIADGATHILTITVTQKLSGTYQSARLAQQELAGQAEFALLDSEMGAGGQAFLVMEAVALAEQGLELDTILSRLREMQRQITMVFMIDNLKYAVRSGRISSWRSSMASILNIKPIMRVDQGLIVEENKVRSLRKAQEYLIQYTQEKHGKQPIRLFVEYAGSPESGTSLKEKARAQLNITHLYFIDMAISIAVNMGPGAIALIAVPESACSFD